MPSTQELLIRLLVGAVFGGIIGYERQVHGRPAGFRTHILVCLSSVLIMELSEYYHHLSIQNPDYVRVDPGRIAAGAITGIGFLGAGVIIKLGANVQGLTTAASIWMVSAMGLAIGAGFYRESSLALVITFTALMFLRFIEKYTPRLFFKTLTISAGTNLRERDITAVLEKHNVNVHNKEYERDIEAKELIFRYTVSIRDTHKERFPIKAIADDLASLEPVKKVSLKN